MCIGGVRYPDRAFAVGEARRDPGVHGGPVAAIAHADAKIAAHEIGHLLGAHHHYANCAEPEVAGDPLDVAPRTLMYNYLEFLDLRFSQLNAAVVRGHAERYAKP